MTSRSSRGCAREKINEAVSQSARGTKKKKKRKKVWYYLQQQSISFSSHPLFYGVRPCRPPLSFPVGVGVGVGVG